jgi:hypothetical protein
MIGCERIAQKDVREEEQQREALDLRDLQCNYWNQNDELVARAIGTMIRATQVGTELYSSGAIQRYSNRAGEIDKAFQMENERELTLYWEDISVIQKSRRWCGSATVGDMVC